MGNSIARYWTLQGPEGRTLHCELLHTARGLEVHATNDELPRRERVHSETDGANIAGAWRALYLAKGWTTIEPPSPAATTMSQEFKIDRSQRIHNDGLVVRVYQVFGTDRYSWDHNREQPPADRPVYNSRDRAEAAADAARRQAGHVCEESCYAWRALM